MRTPARGVALAAALAGALVLAPSPASAQDGPRPFLPDLLPEGDVYRGAFSPDGAEFYYFRGAGEPDGYRIWVTRREDGDWGAPRAVDLGGPHSDLYPTLSPDGRILVFASYRPFPGGPPEERQANLWLARRTADGWSEPRPLTGVSDPTRYESHPLLEADGRLSFRRATVDWSREEALVAQPLEPERWSAPSPDERIERWRGWRSDVHLWGGLPHPGGRLVVLDVSPVRPDGRRGPSDVWVTERTESGWSAPRPVGGGVNTDGWDNFPIFGPDGERVVFVRDFERFYVTTSEALLRRD